MSEHPAIGDRDALLGSMSKTTSVRAARWPFRAAAKSCP